MPLAGGGVPAAVHWIADHRVSDVGHVYPDLVVRPDSSRTANSVWFGYAALTL